MNPELRLYGREYCSLCLVMREQLLQLNLRAVWIEIDDKPDLEACYGEMIPVLVGENEQLICHYHLDRAALDAYLRRFS